ncbi:hypothetical protein Ctob_012414 [Chrysochromulina tobinii]|uniref:Protein nlrc3 n=1 Tax=Chrysochromulina tobinii TaxID=1460289 RepID=A0A0M0JKQ6_9EUKA|nr:hypothetical protein Ctob_012414 [Chrysochromulina tobinii]|eukprot:KOO27154.1 hypothetical protein Ctob_012414 [Chrysochromulina sp. CCMP291]
MPETVAELYASASDAMLARGGVVTAEVRMLLEVVFFEAHVAQARVITDVQLLRAALGAFAPPGTLADQDAKVANIFKTFKGRPEKGHYVELLDGKRKGQHGVIVEDDKSINPYNVKLEDGVKTGYLNPEQLASSGLDEAACRVKMARADVERLLALDGAVQALRDEERAAVAQVRERVGQDRLPLLSLLQVEPLQMQSAHLSFQEFFAAQAICSGKYRLPEGSPPPWQWTAFWANAVTLGSEMGDTFGKGLKQTARVDDVLDLSKKLTGGYRPTMVAAVAQLMRGLASLSLRENKLTDGEGVKMVEALQANTTLAQLNLGGNQLGAESGKAMVEALKTNTALTQLSLNGNKLGDASGCALAVALQANKSLTQLDLGGNELGAESGKGMVEALKTNATLRTVTLDGAVLSIAELSSAASISLSTKRLGDASGLVIAHLITQNQSLTQLSLKNNKLGDASGCALAVALQANKSLTQLDLGGNELGVESGKAMVEALKMNTTFRTVTLDGAVLSIAELTLLKNRFDVESATMLAKISVEKGIMLSGMKRDQTEADFSNKGLQPADAILIGSDLQFMSVLKNCNLLENRFDVESATMLAKIGAERGIMLSGMKRDQTEADLSKKGLQPADAILIGSDLQFMSVLKSCNLLKNSLDVESATMLAKIGTERGIMLSGMKRDQTKASFSRLHSADFIADFILIGSDLQFMAVLTELNLTGNNIGDEGAVAIAEALKVNAAVTNLFLIYNNIGDEGAIAIAEALKVNAVVTNLHLDANNIGAEGAKAIAEALKVNAVLTALGLCDSDIGDDGANAIAEALKVNSVLTELNLESNNIGDTGEKAVQDVVKDRSGFVLML